jgi:hypothetical protein
MRLLFPADSCQNLFAMIEEIAERVENLGLGDVQCLGDLQNRFASLMERNDVTNRGS